jgi:hypothetical protein
MLRHNFSARTLFDQPVSEVCWNRVILQVDDLAARTDALRKAGLQFRNQMEVGPGGKQIQLEDPDGNPIELFEPARWTRT